MFTIFLLTPKFNFILLPQRPKRPSVNTQQRAGPKDTWPRRWRCHGNGGKPIKSIVSANNIMACNQLSRKPAALPAEITHHHNNSSRCRTLSSPRRLGSAARRTQTFTHDLRTVLRIKPDMVNNMRLKKKSNNFSQIKKKNV